MSRVMRNYAALTAIVVAALVLSGPAAAQHVGNSMVDGACLYMKKRGIEIDADLIAEDSQSAGWRRWVDVGAELVNDWMDGRSPLCQIDNPAGVLLATAEYIDRATLDAARGIASIEKAMGKKETLTVVIVELERALAGEQPTAQIDETRIRASEQIGARAQEIKDELDRRDTPFLGSAELEGYVIDSQVALQSSVYYQTQSGLGVATFRDFWEAASDQEREAMLVANKEVGVTSEFAESLPSRGVAMLQNVVKATRLGLSINGVLDEKAVKRSRRAVKAARREQSDVAMQVAQDINAKTTSGFALAGSERPVANAAETVPETEFGSMGADASAMDDPPPAAAVPAAAAVDESSAGAPIPAASVTPAALAASEPVAEEADATASPADCTPRPAAEERKGLLGGLRRIGQVATNVVRGEAGCEKPR